MAQTHRRFRHREEISLNEKLFAALKWSLLFDLGLALVLQPFRPVLVVGKSMSPTFDNQQVVLAKRLDHDPKRGEVVVCNVEDEYLIKRVAGLAGDTNLPGLPNGIRVPWKQVYVLGDNSLVSVDSRTFGPVRQEDVKFEVVYPPSGQTQ